MKDKILSELKEILIKNNLKLSAGESCTGGLISSYLTDIDGSSNFIEQNFVTYAPKAKEKFLNVKKETIDKYSVVSKEVALEMAEGLLEYADASISTTGYSGPTGGDAKNPVGTVFIGVGLKKKGEDGGKIITNSIRYVSKLKNRCEIKEDFANAALKELLSFLKQNV